MNDCELFFRRLIEEAGHALELPTPDPSRLSEAAKQMAGTPAGQQVWNAVGAGSADGYIQQFRTCAEAVAKQAKSTVTWADRAERGIRSAARQLKNPLVMVGAILGVQTGFKLLERMLDDGHHHRTAQLQRDVTRMLETAAITGNVPMVAIAAAGERLLDSDRRGSSAERGSRSR